MTNEQGKAIELAKLLTAFADGKLQYRVDSLWYSYEYDTQLHVVINEIDVHGSENFRIKPETKRVPLNQQDLIDRINEGKTMWVFRSSRNSLITDFNEKCVYFSADVPDYYGVMGYTFLDNSPCYKEVECE